MTKDKLDQILRNHAEWLNDNPVGERANLREADLKGADLWGANLRGADLLGADLRGADLKRANLWRADLFGADLREADLREADLKGADLWGANLRGADLLGADLRGADLLGADLREANLREANLREADLREANLWAADLKEANLREADLRGANLWGANLHRTVLDPENSASGGGEQFEIKPNGRVRGYRTRSAGHIDKYRDGRYYSADVFSTCETECHPGLYLWPTFAQAQQWSAEPLIEVETEPSEIHKAGSKYRCRWFYVIGEVHD